MDEPEIKSVQTQYEELMQVDLRLLNKYNECAKRFNCRIVREKDIDKFSSSADTHKVGIKIIAPSQADFQLFLGSIHASEEYRRQNSENKRAEMVIKNTAKNRLSRIFSKIF